MKTFQIETIDGSSQCVVEDSQVVSMANVLEASATVSSFYIQGLNVACQQNTYGISGHRKWINLIQQ